MLPSLNTPAEGTAVDEEIEEMAEVASRLMSQQLHLADPGAAEGGVKGEKPRPSERGSRSVDLYSFPLPHQFN